MVPSSRDEEDSMKARWLIPVLFLGMLSARGATIGHLPAGGRTTLSLDDNTPFTTVNVAFPAVEGGTLTTASLMWDGAPVGGCADAFRIKILRPNQAGEPFGLTVIANRGPFKAVNDLNVIALSPAIEVQIGDLIALAHLKGPDGCGGVAHANTDLAVASLVSTNDAAAGAVIADAAIMANWTPAIRASSVEDVLHGYIPVVGSLEGNFGSRFKTGLQLSNRTATLSSGRLVFHPAGSPVSSSDPSLPFLLFPDEIRNFDDVVAEMGRSGLGTMDLVMSIGAPPDVTTRVYDDQGAGGTAGFTEELVLPSQVLGTFSSATFTTPPDLANFRLNIGVRTFAQGAKLFIFVSDATGGSVIFPVQKTFPPNTFRQMPAGELLGTVPANGIISVIVLEGSAILYGAVTDNRTNDARLRYFVRQ
jgi:hypothetical protein